MNKGRESKWAKLANGETTKVSVQELIKKTKRLQDKIQNILHTSNTTLIDQIILNWIIHRVEHLVISSVM